MKTKNEIEYEAAPYHLKFTIPAGTVVVPADNMPDAGLWWAEPWPDMDERTESWHRNYGFLLTAEQVTGEIDV